MRDEIDGHIWNEHGRQFSDDLHRLLKSVMMSFQRLQAIQFCAPGATPNPAESP